jgi:cellobiose-specific phosphotransferase system component IIA
MGVVRCVLMIRQSEHTSLKDATETSRVATDSQKKSLEAAHQANIELLKASAERRHQEITQLLLKDFDEMQVSLLFFFVIHLLICAQGQFGET